MRKTGGAFFASAEAVGSPFAVAIDALGRFCKMTSYVTCDVALKVQATTRPRHALNPGGHSLPRSDCQTGLESVSRAP